MLVSNDEIRSFLCVGLELYTEIKESLVGVCVGTCVLVIQSRFLNRGIAYVFCCLSLVVISSSSKIPNFFSLTLNKFAFNVFRVLWLFVISE